MVSRLAYRKFSPTAINTYLRCQLRFYYKYVAGIMEPDNQDEETVDNRVFGNIFHRAAELMYDNLLPKGEITADDIDKLLRDKSLLNSVVAQAINEKLFHRTENLSQMPSLNGMQLITSNPSGTRYVQESLWKASSTASISSPIPTAVATSGLSTTRQAGSHVKESRP